MHRTHGRFDTRTTCLTPFHLFRGQSKIDCGRRPSLLRRRLGDFRPPPACKSGSNLTVGKDHTYSLTGSASCYCFTHKRLAPVSASLGKLDQHKILLSIYMNHSDRKKFVSLVIQEVSLHSNEVSATKANFERRNDLRIS